jgi:ribosome-associated heat shock protein Hsp15
MSRKKPQAAVDTTEPTHSNAGVRLDKWLWAARFYKTRSQAVDDIEKGRVSVNDQVAKASREVRPGDQVRLRQHEQPTPRVVQVLGVSAVRGPAPVAQALYEETAESRVARETWLTTRRFAADPAVSIEQGRPTKHARRQLEAFGASGGEGHAPVPWQRWSASLDDES